MNSKVLTLAFVGWGEYVLFIQTRSVARAIARVY